MREEGKFPLRKCINKKKVVFGYSVARGVKRVGLG